MATQTQAPVENRFLLQDVDWETYEKLRAIPANWRLHMTYDRGDLEIMSPSKRHEILKSLIGRLIEAFTEELNIPIQTTGSTTWKRRARKRGLEADESYYIMNEAIVRGRRDYDPETDPPPDLAVEVEITSSALARMKIYEALGVREVWRHDGERLYVHVLTNEGKYEQRDRSLNLPLLPPAEVERFLREYQDRDETTCVRAFRQWVRETVSQDGAEGN